MGKPREAEDRLLDGNSPSRIAEQMGVTVDTVMGYLFRQLREGRIQRSDILFSIDRQARALVEDAIAATGSTKIWQIEKWIKKSGKQIPAGDVRVYLKLRLHRVEFGDLYESIRAIETFLHDFIRKVLRERYGADWWHELPLEVRQDCAKIKEADNVPGSEIYNYTTVINMKKIFEKNWKELSEDLPKNLRNRNEFLNKMEKLNHIRNAVMHPIKGIIPNDEDFAMVRKFQRELARDPERVRWNELLTKIPVNGPLQ
jgi:DNA-binding transcriptional regulator PaaX